MVSLRISLLLMLRLLIPGWETSRAWEGETLQGRTWGGEGGEGPH